MDDEMKRELHKIIKGLADLSQIVHDGLKDVRSEIQDLRTEFTGVKGEVHGLKADVHGLKADVKQLKTGLQKLTSRFDDFLAQDEVSRLERRTVSETLLVQQRRLDNQERRLQRLEARPA